MDQLFLVLVLATHLTLASTGAADVTYLIRIHDKSNTASVALHMRTNALGRAFQSQDGLYLNEASVEPLARTNSDWTISGNWTTMKVNRKHVKSPLTYDMKSNFLVSSPCDVDNGGCSVFCKMSIDLNAVCLCPPESSLDSDNKTCSINGEPVLGGTSGRFSIPSPYQNYLQLSWNIIVPIDHIVQLTFPVFYTERDCDIVDVYDGLSKYKTRLSHLSGLRHPDTIMSTGNEMLVTFTSDSSDGDYPGFTAKYTAVQKSSTSLKVLTAGDGEGEIISRSFVPTSLRLCVNLIHKPAAPSSEVSVTANLHTGSYIRFARNHFVEAGDQWIIDQYKAELPEDIKGYQINISVILRNGTKLFHISTCNPDANEDVYYVTKSISLDRIKDPEASPNIDPGNSTMWASSQRCYNGGVFNATMNECICPVGFYGNDCYESCGPNRFGEDCGGECSAFRKDCYGVIFCKDNLPCSCAPGIKGRKCDKRCEPGQYGASCKMRCGHCAGLQCDIFTGRCTNGCAPGYYPPLCQDFYQHLSAAPQIRDIRYNTAIITADLNNVLGKGTMRFYQVQYKVKTTSHWMEMQPQEIKSRTVIANITDLQSGVPYDVRIIIINGDGNSYQGSSVPSTELQTMCAVPNSNEYGLKVLRNTASSLEISWKYDILESTWCPISEFEVIIQYQWQQQMLLLPNTSIGLVYSDLHPGRRYELKIRALSEHGKAPFSAFLPVTTEAIAPGRVVNLAVTPAGAGELHVSWSKPWTTGGTIKRYVVEYQCVRLLGCPDSCSESPVAVDVKSLSVMLIGLMPNAQYMVSVAGQAAVIGPYTTVHATTNHRESRVAPTASPMPLIARSNSSFTVQWRAPASCKGLNGFMYEYHFELVNSSDSETVLMSGNTKQLNATFSNLIPDTQYEVHVYYVTSAGINTRQKLAIPVTTSATALDQVQDLTVYKRSRRMIGIRWSSPLLTNGSLLSYIVTRRHLDDPDAVKKSETVAPIRCTSWPNLYCHTINNLYSDANYLIEIEVEGMESEVFGSKASVNGTTSESAPSAPASLRILNRTPWTLELEWSPPNMFNGVLRSFLVNVEETDRAEYEDCCQYFPVQELPVRTEEPLSRLEINGLHPASTVTLSVSAKTVSMGPSVSLTTSTPPETPELEDPPEILPRKSPNGPFTARIHPIEKQQGLTSTYLFLILPPVESMRSTIWNSELSQQLSQAVNESFYVAAEYTVDELLSQDIVEFGTGVETKSGTLGYVQDPVLSPGMYKTGLALVLDYEGARSVGYIESVPFNVE